jgi:hypothetical protein
MVYFYPADNKKDQPGHPNVGHLSKLRWSATWLVDAPGRMRVLPVSFLIQEDFLFQEPVYHWVLAEASGEQLIEDSN